MVKEFSTLWKICHTFSSSSGRRLFCIRQWTILCPILIFFLQAELKEMSLMGTLTPPVEKKVKWCLESLSLDGLWCWQCRRWSCWVVTTTNCSGGVESETKGGGCSGRGFYWEWNCSCKGGIARQHWKVFWEFVILFTFQSVGCCFANPNFSCILVIKL